MNRDGVFLRSIDVVAEHCWTVYDTLLCMSTLRRGGVVWNIRRIHVILTEPELMQLATSGDDFFVLLPLFMERCAFFGHEERRCVLRCLTHSCV